MSARRLLDALAANRPVFGTALKTCDPAIVEVIAVAGYDWVSISIEHSSLSMAQVAELQRAADARGITTLIHVAEPDDPRILPLLNEGIGGVVGCQVESAEEAEAWVQAAHYPPRGRRGAAGVVRRADYGALAFDAYAAKANAEVAVGIVIETVKGVEHVEEILAVPDVTFAYVGMHDLTLSMGCPGDFTNPEALAMIKRVVAAAQANGLVVGLSEKGYTAAELWQLGARMIISPTGEYTALLEAFQTRIARARAEIDAVTCADGTQAVTS